jgi:hypothetical protein
VVRQAESGGPWTDLADLPIQDASLPLFLAVGEADVFVADPNLGQVWRIPRQGGEAVSVASGQTDLSYIVADEEFVYWLTTTRLMRLPQH